jgi:hypothetical protein
MMTLFKVIVGFPFVVADKRKTPIFHARTIAGIASHSSIYDVLRVF